MYLQKLNRKNGENILSCFAEQIMRHGMTLHNINLLSFPF